MTSQQVKISANEMKFFIKRSLEGMGFNPGEQLEAGKRIAMAWQFGLANSALLDDCLKKLNPHVKQPQLVSQQGHLWHFDALGQSALVQAELAVGVALANQGHVHKQVIINNVHHGVLLAPALMGWLSKPLSGGKANQPMVLLFHDEFINANNAFSANTLSSTYALYIDEHGVLKDLRHAPDQFLENKQIKLHIGTAAILGDSVMAMADFVQSKASALANGLSIDVAMLNTLKTLIVASFVPESEGSQAGAGPG